MDFCLMVGSRVFVNGETEAVPLKALEWLLSTR